MHDAIPRIITFPLIDYVMQRNTWPAKTEQPSAGCGNNYMITEKNNNTSTTMHQTLVAESSILILPQKTEIMLLHQCRERENFLMRIIELLMFIAETSRLQELPSLLICRQIFMRLSALRLFLYYMTFLLRTFYAFQHS